jgi:hypothetical protein
MKSRTSLLGGAALGALLGLAIASTAGAAVHHHRKVVAAADSSVKDDVAALKAEVQALEAWKDQQAAERTQTQQQVQQLQAQLADANARADHAEQVAQAQIQTIPGVVDAEVAKARPKSDKIYYKGVTLTLGGFAAAEAVYRTRNDVADIGSNYSKIPYGNSVLAHADEFHATGRQSRISFLAQGDVNPDVQAGFYGEFDFLAAPQTANSNESNSYSPRIRNLYGTVDWKDEGWHVLAGQNWSLVTMNGKGVSPRNEVIPPTIEAQYVPGFVWARQPQLRIAKDFDDRQIWVAASLENAQTTIGSPATGVGTTLGGITVANNAAGIAEFNSANNYSFNRVPDAVGKVAYEPDIGGARPVHAELFGLVSQYYDRVSVAAGSQATLAGLAAGNFTDTSYGGGVGGGVTWTVVPSVLDVQASALTGWGIGRYGAGQLPDVVVGPTGKLEPIRETMAMGGVTWHATKQLDLYVFGGGEFEDSQASSPLVAGTRLNLGYGNNQATLGNCFVELGSCSPNTQSVDQVTVGLWDKVWTGSFGQVRVGLQYAHTDLRAFSGIAGANTAGLSPTATVKPTTSDDMVFTSFRYYPF